MGIIICKIGLLASDIGLVYCAMAQVIDPIKEGERLGQLTTAGILGVVSVVCVLGLVLLYRDQKKHVEKLYQIIEENTKAHQVASTNASHVAGIMVEVKDAILKCQKE